MKTKKLLPFLISTLLFGALLCSITEKKTQEDKKEELNNSHKARYTFSLQLFQTI